MGQQRRRIMGDGIGHDVDLRPKQRRRQKLPHRNVKTLGGGLRNDVSAAEIKIGLFAELVVEHPGLLNHHPFGRAGRARGEHHISQRVGSGVDARLFSGVTGALYVFPHQQLGALLGR